ncbi:MAG: hypothetical protein ACXVCP_16635 [Bdellovibrio sp.]
MKTLLLLVTMATITGLQASADVGDGSQLSCGNGSTTFEIHSTAIPETYQGYYSPIGNNLNCVKVKGKKAANMNAQWKCVEDREGDGKVVIVIEKGGYTGMAIANVYQEQVYPLKPAYLGSLQCQ